MTLIVTAPGPNPITTYASGVKIVRLAEYLGGARGTLTTVADADSPAGTAIKDTQELAAASTFTGRGGSVSDTASIPVADLGIGADALYVGYLGIRLVGRPPVGARATEKWQYQNLAAGPSVCRLHDGTVTDYFEIPREFYAGYTLIRAGSFSQAGFGATTNLKFRAFGITGGSMEFYLDLLYLVPAVLESTDDAGSFSGEAFPPLLLQLSSGGDLGPDDDNNTTNSIGSAHSVMPDFYFDSVWDFDVSYDIQDAEYEKSIVDWKGIFSVEPNRQASYFYFRAGSRLVTAHTIETEDFSSWPGNTPGPQVAETTEGYILESAVEAILGVNTKYGSNFNPGWYLMNSGIQFLGPIAGPFGDLPAPNNEFAYWSIGTWTNRTTGFPGGASNPQNKAPLLQGFDSIIQLYKVNLLMSHTGGDVELHFGAGRWSLVDTAHQIRVTTTAKVIHHADGTHAIAIESQSDGGAVQAVDEFVSPVTVMGGLAPGDSYWVRVEKRFNHWRARCWIDGDTEPGTWDVEGFAPAWVGTVSAGAGIRVPVEYPYNTNWPTDVTVVDEDPRFWHGGNTTNGSPFTPWMHEVRATITTGFDTDNYEIRIDEFTLSYDPDYPDNSGAYTGAYFRTEKYDGTVDWGTAYIPPGAWRIVSSDFASHHFYGDSHGGNVYAWKETGAHPLQAAAWEIFSFRRPARGPRWGDITYP